MPRAKEKKQTAAQPAVELTALRARVTELEEALREREEWARQEGRTRIDLALQRVRNEILSMQGEEDWDKVASCLGRELGKLIEFDGCGVAIVDRERRQFFVYDVTPAGSHRGKICDFLPRSLEQALETGMPVCRRNREEMARFGDNIGPERKSAVDAPFAGGTIGLNSAREDAFSDRDIAILQQFAQVVSEAHRRLEDLKVLTLREVQLRQVQRLEAVGQLAIGVAHEINNPLTSVLGYSELLLRQKELDPQVRQHLETIYQEGERARRIAERLLRFARRQQVDKQWVNLNPLVQEALELIRRPFEMNGVRLAEELAADLPLVEVHPGQVQQVVLGLVQNSRDAILRSGKGGVVTVRTAYQEGRVRLAVEDDGPGIPEEIRERIFDPFFTTKEVGTGVGLGLSTAFRLAQDWGGRLWAEARQQGACLVLELPAAAGI